MYSLKSRNTLQRGLMRSINVLLVLMMLLPQGVFIAIAQDETPTDTPTEEVTPAPEETATEEASTEEATATEETASDEASRTELVCTPILDENGEPTGEEECVEVAVEATEEPAAEETATEEPAAEPTAEPTEAPAEDVVAEAVVALDEVGAVLTDADGNEVSMASEAAAEVLATTDPYFTVAGVTYGFADGGGCPAFVDVCDNSSSNPIQDALDYLRDILVALPDDGTIYVESGTSYPGFTIEGFNFPGQDLIITGFSPSEAGDSEGDPSAGTGAQVEIWDDIYIDDNNVNIKLMYLFLDGNDTIKAGSYDSNTGDLTLENITVDTDSACPGDYSIDIHNQYGNVTLTNVTVSDNDCDDGVHIGDVYKNEGSGGNVTLTNVTSEKNDADGVDIHDVEGDVTLDNVTAKKNDDNGIEIDDVDGNVSISNSEANNNDDNGIRIGEYSGSLILGTVTLTNVTANNNDNDGILIENVGDEDHLSDVELTMITTKNNGDDGIDIYYTYGNLTLDDITSNNNGDDGIDIDDIGDENQLVSLNNVKTNNNDDNGVTIYEVYGSVSVTNATSKDNGDNGLVIGDVDYNVFVDPSVFNNNSNEGLYIYDVDGNVTLMDITAKFNGKSGARVQDIGGSVELTNGTFNDNDGRGFITKDVDGHVTLNGIKANDNDKEGISVKDVGGNVFIDDAITKSNGISGSEDGILVRDIDGHVTINNFTSNLNYGRGVNIFYIGGDVTLTDGTTKSNNEGIELGDIDGDVLLSLIKSNNNNSDGVEIDDIVGNIFVLNSTFNENGADGLDIDKDDPGIVTIDGVTAKKNGDNGIEIEDVDGGAVFITNTIANKNFSHGLDFDDDMTANIFIADSQFNNNDFHGISNDYILYGNLTLSNVVANSNYYNGIWFYEIYGNVVFNQVTANENGFGPGGYGGVDIDTIFGNLGIFYSQFNGNDLDGFRTYVTGTIYVYGVEASGNSDDGLDLSADVAIYICKSTFIENGDYGFSATAGSPGTVYQNGNVFSGNGSGDYLLNGGTLEGYADECDWIAPDPEASVAKVLGGRYGGEYKLNNHATVNFPDSGLACFYTFARVLNPDYTPWILDIPQGWVEDLNAYDLFPIFDFGGDLFDSLDPGYITVIGVVTEGCKPEGYTYSITFEIPAGGVPADYKVMFWNGTDWNEVPASIVDGQLVVTGSETGAYALIPR